jgi:hypothetical protein
VRRHLVRWTVAAALAAGLVVASVAPAGAAEIPVEGSFDGPGSFVNEPCRTPDHPPDQAPIGTAFEATGTLSSLGTSDVDVVICLDPIVGGNRVFGPLTITAPDGTLTADTEGSLALPAPIGGPYVFDITGTVTGGTGDLEGATGSLDLAGSFTLSPFVVEGSISGTVTLPPNTPTSKDDCKHGGWRDFEDENGEPFTSQRDCIRWVKDHLP